MNPLRDVYGDLLVVRPPVPATVNKAGANYKSEVAHLTYSPRRAYDEWLSILDAIRAYEPRLRNPIVAAAVESSTGTAEKSMT